MIYVLACSVVAATISVAAMVVQVKRAASERRSATRSLSTFHPHKAR